MPRGRARKGGGRLLSRPYMEPLQQAVVRRTGPSRAGDDAAVSATVRVLHSDMGARLRALDSRAHPCSRRSSRRRSTLCKSEYIEKYSHLPLMLLARSF